MTGQLFFGGKALRGGGRAGHALADFREGRSDPQRATDVWDSGLDVHRVQ